MVDEPLIGEIRDLLQSLRERDRSLRVFGAEMHGYKSHPVSDWDLLHFESMMGVQLPDGFREFLLAIGYGAGPYYGILSLEQMTEEFVSWRSDARDCRTSGEASGSGDPGRPFLGTHADAIAALGRREAHGPYMPVPPAPDGLIRICHQGCAYWTLLVTCGELCGRVLDFGEDQMDAFPAAAPTAISEMRFRDPAPEMVQVPTFLEWYETWLRRSLRDLERVSA